jgi:hypothetical protein
MNNRRLTRVPRPMRALILLWLVAVPLAAAPAWQRELTPAKPGAWPAIQPSALEYQVSWKGMLDSGRLRMEFAPRDAHKPGMIVVRSTARSTGPASRLYPYQSHFWSEIDSASLRPRYFHAVETDRREMETTIVRHHKGRVVAKETSKPLRKGPTVERTQEFRFDDIYDIFSAMLHVRSQELAIGERIALVVHPFDNPYLLDVRVAGREIHRERKTIRLTVSMRKIDRETHELRPYKKMKRPATLWLSDDEHRIPVELRAAVFIGDVRAVLTDFRRL